MTPGIFRIWGGGASRSKPRLSRKPKGNPGSRGLLNLGHTLGHAIEAVAGYGTLLHGEAVALGMVAAAQVSAERAGLPKEEIEELVGVIRQLDLPTTLPDRLSRKQILEKVFADKT